MPKYTSYAGENDQGLEDLFCNTFTDSEGAEEGKVIGQLVRQLLHDRLSDDVLVFLALRSDAVIGAILFSPFSFENSDLRPMLMSPVAVATAEQGNGIGQGLIAYAHSALLQRGVPFTITYGDIQFYGKCGYTLLKESNVPAPHKLSYPEGWLGRPLAMNTIPVIEGPAYGVAAFQDPQLW